MIIREDNLSVCPVCKSNAIDLFNVDVDYEFDYVVVEMHCTDCGSVFERHYNIGYTKVTQQGTPKVSEDEETDNSLKRLGVL